jgi:4'-phosphopantetheinyl transferase
MTQVEFPSLEQQDVHVWRVTLDGLDDDWNAILHPNEIARAARFVSPLHQKRYAAARGMLRILLSRYLGVEPAAICLAARPAGKPFVETPETDLRFNVAHSDHMALYAFARGEEVGVDIERKRPGVDMEGISGRFFSPREAETISALRGPEVLEFFYRLWTLKEAYAKGTGEGLTHLLQVEVLPDSVLPSPWRLHSLDLPGEFAAAVAVQAERCIRVLDWPRMSCTL